ncbi:hypothetical protein ColLi_12480 [Colletotrichum liriopes]|uniref:Uncharacterized protein n=1 Tax=Colletotrichum liriopes TaxID=708192 RepID=A0AA37H0G0_9PEZI|nr:hypothetical protein ColLi_12480 [Colletotrichum liriopes]
MSTKFSKNKTPLTREEADGSGPSQRLEEENAAVVAVSQVYKALTSLVRGLTAIIRILNHLNMNINVATIPPDDDTAPEVWKEHRQEFKETLVEVYNATDRVLEMATCAEKHLDAGEHERLVRDVHHVRERIFLFLPQELYDCLVGKGKGVTRRK